MSRAFVKESEGEWLHDVEPTLGALMLYLRRENNGIRVTEQRSYPHPETGKTVHEMSNGLSYSLDADGRWYLVA